MYKKLLFLIPILILLSLTYKSIFWWVRDYYYQLTLGAFVVDYELGCKDRLSFQASIKKLTPDSIINQIDPNYFTAVGYQEWQRIPLVYPYTMNAFADFQAPNENFGNGAFLTNSLKTDYTQENSTEPPGAVAYANDEYGEVKEENIIAFSFNDKYVIGKKRTEMENSLPTAESVTSYFIFEFATNELKHLNSYKELEDKASKLGFKRHLIKLDYTRETRETKEYRLTERAKFLKEEETELVPFQLYYDRFTGLPIEL